MLNEQQKKDFILALETNHLATVQHITQEDSSSLDLILNNDGSKAIHMAAQHRAFDVLTFLIEKNPDMLHVLDHNGKTAFDFITSATQALDFMILSRINAQLMINNPRIMALIHAWDNHTTTSSIGFYKTAKRHPSFYVNIDRVTGELDVFNPDRILGKGNYGSVRAFMNSKGETIAVKKPFEVQPKHSIDAILREVHDYKKEIKITNLAYNNTADCRFFYFVKSTQIGIPETELRCVIPYVPGQSAHRFIPTVQCKHTLTQLILKMTEALITLHEKNIIHGDIKLDNIMIAESPTYQVAFIDFGLAYLATDQESVVFSTDEKTEHTQYIAPERFLLNNNEALRPHTNQDVFSFAHMVKHHIIQKHHDKSTLQLMYPCINTFTQQALSSTPTERPTLLSFHAALSSEITYNVNMEAITTPQVTPPTTEAAPCCGIH